MPARTGRFKPAVGVACLPCQAVYLPIEPLQELVRNLSDPFQDTGDQGKADEKSSDGF